MNHKKAHKRTDIYRINEKKAHEFHIDSGTFRNKYSRILFNSEKIT